MLEVKRELTIEDLDDFFWSGARDRWLDADEEQREAVWERLETVFTDEIPSETEVNDYVWFECDDIFYRRNESLLRRKLRERREMERDEDMMTRREMMIKDRKRREARREMERDEMERDEVLRGRRRR